MNIINSIYLIEQLSDASARAWTICVLYLTDLTYLKILSNIIRLKDFKSAVIFDGIADALKNDGANLIQKVKGIFGFKVKGPNGNEVLWIVDAKNGSGKVEVNGKGTNLM